MSEICVFTYTLQIISICLCSEVSLMLLAVEMPSKQELQYGSNYKTN
ncbi:hypothetical protein GALL_112670 [mine drainage metagenome]|uniref:Uncharacterized protein n=1 Tax=mine drainage metagenome TaxID=410659 RepID=A0A1J5SYI1_9ZZZZ